MIRQAHASDILAAYEISEHQEQDGSLTLTVAYPDGITATGPDRLTARDRLMEAIVRYWQGEKRDGFMPADFNPYAPHELHDQKS